MDNYFTDRSWMYKKRRVDTEGSTSEHFNNGVSVFMDFALRNNGNYKEIRCPCSKCKLLKHLIPQMVRVHLRQYGFVSNYLIWDRHEEQLASNPVQDEEVVSNEIGTTNLVEHMVEDAARSMFSVPQLTDDDGNAEEEPKIGTKKYMIC